MVRDCKANLFEHIRDNVVVQFADGWRHDARVLARQTVDLDRAQKLGKVGRAAGGVVSGGSSQDDAETLNEQFDLVGVNRHRYSRFVVVWLVRRLRQSVEYPPQLVHIVRAALNRSTNQSINH